MATSSSSGQRSTSDQLSGTERRLAAQRAGQRSEVHQAKHVHHGRTPASWAGSLTALVAFIIGGIGFVLPPHPNWVVIIIATIILVAGLIATVVLRKMGHGAD